MKRLPGTSWLWAGSACLLLLVGLRLEILQRRSLADPSPAAAVVPITNSRTVAVDHRAVASNNPAIGRNSPTAAAPLPTAPVAASGTAADRREVRFDFVGPISEDQPAPAAAYGTTVITDTLGRDDSIYLALVERDIAERQILELVNALGPVFDARQSQPNDIFTAALDTAGIVTYFHYTQRQRPEAPIFVERRDDVLVAQRLTLQTRTQQFALWTTIETDLSNAILAAGERDQLTELVADGIFGAVIDFHKHPRRGDRIGLVFEKEFLGDRFLRYGAIELAQYEGQLISQVGVAYEAPDGTRGYYDEDGKSLARMFLLSPIRYLRISSGFNRRRFHPILKRPIPHLGTDYAANTGTRVRTTAHGTVVHAGWKGSYGKLVEIEHANGYRTRYAHLSRISVKRGNRVRQEDVIGRVGATGRATGPHLHYELIKNGVHMDPERANSRTKGKPLVDGLLAAFTIRHAQLSQELESRTTAEPVTRMTVGKTN